MSNNVYIIVVGAIASAHDLLNELSAPIKHIEEVKNGFESFIPTQKDDKKESFITFFNELDRCKDKLPLFEALIAKIEMFDFAYKNECYEVYEEIVVQYEKIEKVAYSIRNYVLNWQTDNDITISSAVNNIDLEEMEKNLKHGYHKLIKFTKKNYKLLIL